MLRALFDCVRAAVISVSGGIGTFFTVLAGILHLNGEQQVSPSWFLLIAAAAFLVLAVQLQWQLMQARQRATMNMTSADLLVRICGTSDATKAPQAITRAFHGIREKAANGELTTWGRKDWTSATSLDAIIRTQIPASDWTSNQLDWMSYLSDNRTQLVSTKDYVSSDYIDIWFDKREVDQIWPPRKAGLRTRIGRMYEAAKTPA